MLITVTPVGRVKGGGLYGGVVAPLPVTPDPVERQTGRGHGIKSETLKHSVRCSANSQTILK